MKLTLLSATALLMATVASAETRLSTSAFMLDMNGADQEGLMAEIDGTQNAFDYVLRFQDGEIADTQAQGFYTRLGWTPVALGGFNTGPVVAYSAADVAGAGGWQDQTALGVMARFDNGVLDATATVMSDVDDFGDDAMLGLEVDYAVTETWDVISAYDYADANSAHSLELGGRYTMDNKFFVEAAGLYMDANGTDGTGARLGVGVEF